MTTFYSTSNRSTSFEAIQKVSNTFLDPYFLNCFNIRSFSNSNWVCFVNYMRSELHTFSNITLIYFKSWNGSYFYKNCSWKILKVLWKLMICLLQKAVQKLRIWNALVSKMSYFISHCELPYQYTSFQTLPYRIELKGSISWWKKDSVVYLNCPQYWTRSLVVSESFIWR